MVARERGRSRATGTLTPNITHRLSKRLAEAGKQKKLRIVLTAVMRVTCKTPATCSSYDSQWCRAESDGGGGEHIGGSVNTPDIYILGGQPNKILILKDNYRVFKSRNWP